MLRGKAFLQSLRDIVLIFFSTEGKDACVLSNGAQQDIRALEWRPNGGKSLSVACKQVSKLKFLSLYCDNQFYAFLLQGIKSVFSWLLDWTPGVESAYGLLLIQVIQPL
jgi:hypothetical protein